MGNNLKIFWSEVWSERIQKPSKFLSSLILLDYGIRSSNLRVRGSTPLGRAYKNINQVPKITRESVLLESQSLLASTKLSNLIYSLKTAKLFAILVGFVVGNFPKLLTNSRALNSKTLMLKFQQLYHEIRFFKSVLKGVIYEVQKMLPT